MLIADLLAWWYGPGWALLVRTLFTKVKHLLEAFSITLLLQTLFSPFRQISVGRVSGPLDIQLRAWLDLQLSRLIGALLRLFIIIIGLGISGIAFLLSLLVIIVWPTMPFIPLIMLVVALEIK